MTDCRELALEQWRAGVVDGFALAVFVVLIAVAVFAGLVWAAAAPRRAR